jgi:hypothetical protein
MAPVASAPKDGGETFGVPSGRKTSENAELAPMSREKI